MTGFLLTLYKKPTIKIEPKFLKTKIERKINK